MGHRATRVELHYDLAVAQNQQPRGLGGGFGKDSAGHSLEPSLGSEDTETLWLS